MYEKILAGFKFGDFLQNCQFPKLKISPKFPAIRYVHVPQCVLFSAQPYSDIDENDSDVDVDDEEDDLLADGEGVPEDDIEEVEPQE